MDARRLTLFPSPAFLSQSSRQSQPTLWKPTPLTVPFVFNKVTEIAKTTGANVSLPSSSTRDVTRSLILSFSLLVDYAQDRNH